MSNREKDKRFGEVGIELGFFTREDFNRATILQKTDEAIGVSKPIGAYLLKEDKVTKLLILNEASRYFLREFYHDQGAFSRTI